MVNYFKGFRYFHEAEEKEERPDNYISTVKKQIPLIKKSLWFGMPVIVSNTKLGKTMIRDPRVFFVTDFDDGTVTIRSVQNPGLDGEGNDEDDEITLDRNEDPEEQSFTIPRDDFYKLLEPPNFQGADFKTASGAALGGGGGGGGGMM